MQTNQSIITMDQPNPSAAGKPALVTIIEPLTASPFINWAELWRYRDLLRFLMWRDIKVRYAQSILGIGWAIIQPTFNMIIFTIIFGNLVQIRSDGVPYALFSYTALVPWTYFAAALNESTSSLVNAAGMISKVYFPRLVIPLAPVLARLLDFAIALVLLALLMAGFGLAPTPAVAVLPLLVLIMILAAVGAGMWLTALSVQYRDIKYGIGLVVQLLMYASPVVYPASLIPTRYRLFYGLNPMAGVIEGFRAALLGTQPLPWDLIGVGSLVALLLVGSGLLYFRRMEAIFADVV